VPRNSVAAGGAALEDVVAEDLTRLWRQDYPAPRNVRDGVSIRVAIDDFDGLRQRTSGIYWKFDAGRSASGR